MTKRLDRHTGAYGDLPSWMVPSLWAVLIVLCVVLVSGAGVRRGATVEAARPKLDRSLIGLSDPEPCGTDLECACLAMALCGFGEAWACEYPDLPANAVADAMGGGCAALLED